MSSLINELITNIDEKIQGPQYIAHKFIRIMSDNITLQMQRACTEGDYYMMDMFSSVQPAVSGNRCSRNQVNLLITRALVDSGRLAFIKQMQSKQRMIKIYSNSFCWKKAQGSMLNVKLVMEDFQAEKQIEKKKIDEMKLSENVVFTLPSCDASIMKVVAELMDEDRNPLFETGELNVELSMPQGETRAGVEHDHCTNQPSERRLTC
ncbi:hypothetical protein OS493_035423 [Desmophyllum pertusum]|uniref:Uncharacterized protein n=1 Tax=Desmophyllum pertusum TaxID=174260 RepID=A0A9X0D1L3_9CNID|nr:hypothetical protein OS493_035423 [Desmophyllum pertusum]